MKYSRHISIYQKKQNIVLYLMLLIPLAYILIFCYYPMFGAQIAFRDFSFAKGITGSKWVGLKHFNNFFKNKLCWRLIRNTLSISFYSIATFPIAIILAVLIHIAPVRFVKKSTQMITYLPYFISTVVMCSIIQKFLSTYGPVNQILQSLGLDKFDFLGSADHFAGMYVWTGVWQSMGYNSIIYISALAGVDPEMHEAACIDGASLFQRIIHIDLPAIIPTIVIMFILRCGSILNVGYEKVYLLQNTLNQSTSEIISTYVYKTGLTSALPQYSYATAIGLFVSAVNLIVLWLANMITGKLSGTSLW